VSSTSVSRRYSSYVSLRESSGELGNVTEENWLLGSIAHQLYKMVLDMVCEWTARKSIVGASELQFNGGIYAEVPLWCASGPIARRWIVPTCVWKLSDCNLGVSVGRLAQEVLLEEF
jgi:hypothetical protein